MSGYCRRPAIFTEARPFKNRRRDSERAFLQDIPKKTKMGTPAPNLLQIPLMINAIRYFALQDELSMLHRVLTLTLTLAVITNGICLWSYL